MNNQATPTLLETALGGLLQDIGKFMLRAHGSVQHMDPRVRERESVILPEYKSRYSHKHVLWTEAFFQWMEDQGLSFPKGVNLHQVRNMAVFHHKPETFGALGWLAAEADRLSSGMDRKPKDESLESEGESRGWDRFIKTAMWSPFCQVDLGMGKPPRRIQALAELIPDERLLPQATVNTAAYPETYARLWQKFTSEFSILCRETDNLDLFCEGLLSLSERYTWAIPSSTVDLPDISLHDHNRTVAAIAACLHAWHAQQGTLNDVPAIKDRNLDKFRLLAGDLSGIQSTLFILAHQQVKGVNKILRARSFLMGMLLDAAALYCRRALGLPVFNLLQNAGGRFVLLVPNLPGLKETLENLRGEIDAWMGQRYLGELALNLALSAPFSGQDLIPPRFHQVQESLGRALDEAKQQSLRGFITGVLAMDYEHGECAACGKRPARHLNGDGHRCDVCHEEHRVGGWLPRITAASWQSGQPRGAAWSMGFFNDLNLVLHEQPPQHATGLLSGFRLYRGEDDTRPGSWALRFIANYVPRLAEGEQYNPAYDELSEDALEVRPGEIKTFERLAQDALEPDKDGELLGKPFLAVLKADVDRLGMLFSFGFRDPDTDKDRATISRYAALSRMLDLFFTGYLQDRLRKQFPHTYTVYAGGDDLLLIGPWRQMIVLVGDLNTQFRLYTGDNPSITLSAGLELMRSNHPLNRSVWAAEERLDRAKHKDAKHPGRNRVCLIDQQPIPWDELSQRLADADVLNDWLRDKLVSTAVIYKLLYFAGQRIRAEDKQGMDLECANWRARWGYHLARNVRESKQIPEHRKPEVITTLNRLMGLDEHIKAQDRWISPRIPVSIALYRNRT